MAIEPMSAAKGAFEAVRSAKKGLEKYVDLKAEIQSQEAVTGALERLGAALDSLFDLREALSDLQDDNAQLKDRLRSYETWDQRASEYALTRTRGGAVVYRSDGPPEHFACPSCYERREIQVLQESTGFASASCPGCRAKFMVKPTATAGRSISAPWAV